jgi:ATP-binding cassette, subfamily F, member 3
MLHCIDVSLAFGPHTIFSGLTVQINPGDRIGLIGRNGAGKSTLFKLLMGELTPDKGKLIRTPGMRINCLTQEPQITHGNSLLEEVRSVFPSLKDVEAEEASLMATWEKMTPDEQMAACERLAELQHVKDEQAGLDGKISALLTGLGFEIKQFDQLVELFSGGWQMRINLAKILLQAPDFLLMDEPTNHLDLEACEWLEGFLREYPGGMVLVSHDRRFLDEVVTSTAEIEHQQLTIRAGNYSRGQALKQEEYERLVAAAERQKKELAKQQAFVDRFRASATKSTQAKSREKQLAKIEKIDPPRQDKQKMHLRFPVPEASSKDVLTLKRLSKSYASPLFQEGNATLERGERIFLLGHNGCGKTTLLRLILGLETPDKGEIKLGSRVKIGYFSQHQLETLDPKLNVLQTIEQISPPDMSNTDIRGLLGRFLFSGDRVEKQVETLSGGEKSRLALARLLIQGANFLLLDEPTNHMDIPAQQVMEEAFKQYEGSILCISHDRQFIQQVATGILEIYKGHLISYDCSYDEYLTLRTAKREKTLREAPTASKTPLPESRKEQALTPSQAKKQEEKTRLKIEKEMITLEDAIQSLQETMAVAHTDYEALAELHVKLEALQAEHAELSKQWESLVV